MLANIDVALDYQNRSVDLRIDQAIHNGGILTETVRSLTAQMVTVVNLLEYLEKNGYVSTYYEAAPGQHERFGQLVQGNPFITYTLPDRKLTDLLLDNSLKSILVGQPLIEFVTDDFRTKDDKAYRTNVAIALITLVASVLIGLVSLCLNYKSLPPTAIDQPSINQITAPMVKAAQSDSAIKENTDRLLELLHHDTLSVRAVESRTKRP